MSDKHTLNIMKKLKEKIFDPSFLNTNRIKNSAFTRKRKLSFPYLVLFMINMIKQTLQKELTLFVEMFGNKKTHNITKSAFSQTRMNLKPQAFIELNQLLISEFYEHNDYKIWNNYRLLGIDGSTLNLPKSKETLTSFGVKQKDDFLPLARISSLYDLLNDIILDSQLSPISIGEFDLAIKHLNHVKKNDLIIADRGYGAIWLFFYLLQNKTNFVIRLRKRFIKEIDSFWESKENSRIIQINKCPKKSQKRLKDLNLSFKSFKFRIVKIMLDNGEIEVLATSLLDENEFPNEIFKDLYFVRWGIEINYNHLKSNIQLEIFSGKSVLAVKQDFFANMLASNIQGLFIKDAQKELEKRNKGKNKKYEYKINKNLSLGYLKYEIIKIFIGKNEKKSYLKLKKLFLLEPVPIRDNRKYPREIKHVRKHHSNLKRSI